MIEFPFDDVINTVYNAKKGVEVRKGLGQMGEYCKEFTEEAGKKADAARDEAKGYAENAAASEQKAAQTVQGIEQTKADAVQAVQQAQTTATQAVGEKQTAAEQAVDTAQTSALEAIGTAHAGALADVAASTQTAANAAAEAGAAKTAAAGSASAAASAAGAASTSAGEAAASADNAATSADNANADAERAEAAAKKAEAVVSTDKTLTVSGAPADAAAVGEALGKKADASQVQDEKGEVRFYSKADVDKLLAQCKTDTMLAAHPVKSWYFSDDPTSPAAIFGGTWEQHTDGRSLIGAGGTYTVGSTGGEATHTLTVDEMPRHLHDIRFGGTSSTEGNVTSMTSGYSVVSSGYWWSERKIVNFTGGSLPHNNMPPYYATYIWQRFE